VSDLGVVGDLGTQPVPVGQTKETAQPQISVGGNGSPTCHDLADPLSGNADLLSQAVLRNAIGRKNSSRSSSPGVTGGTVIVIFVTS